MPPNSLEQEAMDRVARMYASYDRRPQRRPQTPAPPKPPKPEPEPEPEPEPPKLPEPAVKKQGGFLELLMKDKDQSLILLLLVILMKDGADLNLTLALLYLLI